ncbi:uncharacterized protein METZ01_LOCUS288124, partial [marine metagenome]
RPSGSSLRTNSTAPPTRPALPHMVKPSSSAPRMLFIASSN